MGKIALKKILLYISLFLVSLALRTYYGTTMFAGEDAFQIYLIGLKWHTSGCWPYWGPDVVYTFSQIPGALQGLLVGLPFKILEKPESPFVLLNFLSVLGLFILAWYVQKRIEGVPKWFVWGWLLTSPWTLAYSAHVENPSYLLLPSVLFFISLWETLSIYEKKCLSPFWAFFFLGASMCWVAQLHLSWVLMASMTGGAFLFKAYRRDVAAISGSLAGFVLGCALTVGPLLPTFFRFGFEAYSGNEGNVSVRWQNILYFPDIVAKTLSFATGEVVRFIGADHHERFAFLKERPWCAPFTVIYAIMGVVQFVYLAVKLLRPNPSPIFRQVRLMTISVIGLLCLSFLFANIQPKAHTFYLLFPLAMWYSFYCYPPLFKRKSGHLIAALFLLSGVIFHLGVADRNNSRYGLILWRGKVEDALRQKDHTVLGLRRESVMEQRKRPEVWAKTVADDRSASFHTGFEYEDCVFMPQNIKKQAAMSGEWGCKIDSLQPYGAALLKKIEMPKMSSCHFSAFLRKRDYRGELLLVCEWRNQGKMVHWQSVPVQIPAGNLDAHGMRVEQEKGSGWVKTTATIEVPSNLPSFDEVLVCLWMPSKHPGNVFVDETTVQFR